MAFEGLYKFCDEIAELHDKTDHIGKQIVLIQVLAAYHETALSSAKFKEQRNYCLKTIYRLNPSFFKGRFKRNQP